MDAKRVESAIEHLMDAAMSYNRSRGPEIDAGDIAGNFLNDKEMDDGCQVKTRTFEEAGVLTIDALTQETIVNRGLVLSFPDGSEFQVTIVQSK